MSDYGFGKSVALSFDAALDKVIQALQAEGFGVLTDIDVAATMNKKLGHVMPPYRILGACNPPLALRALQADSSIGLLLPCNVVVREDTARIVHVEFLDPNVLVQLVHKSGIVDVALEVRQRLVRVLESI